MENNIPSMPPPTPIHASTRFTIFCKTRAKRASGRHRRFSFGFLPSVSQWFEIY